MTHMGRNTRFGEDPSDVLITQICVTQKRKYGSFYVDLTPQNLFQIFFELTKIENLFYINLFVKQNKKLHCIKIQFRQIFNKAQYLRIRMKKLKSLWSVSLFSQICYFISLSVKVFSLARFLATSNVHLNRYGTDAQY